MSVEVAFPGLPGPQMPAAEKVSDNSSDGSDIGTQEWLREKTRGLKALKAMFYDPQNEKLSDHFIKFDKLINHLWCIGMAFDDSDLLCQLLLTLPPDYESIVLDYCANGIPTMEIVQAKLLLTDSAASRRRRKRALKLVNFDIIDKIDKNNEVPAFWQCDVKKEPVFFEDDNHHALGWDDSNELPGQDCAPETVHPKLEGEVEAKLEIELHEGEVKPEKKSKKRKHTKRKLKDKEHKTKKPKDNAGSREFKCSICDKSYNKRQNFSNHIKIHMSDFECKRCGEKFTAYDAFRKHKKDVHSGDTETCKICEKTVEKSAIYRHLATHNEKTQYLCPTCGKNYKTQTGLQSHINDFHSTDNRSMDCKICGKSVLKISMQSHMVLHKDKKYLCTICAKPFHWKNSLLVHMKNHGQQLPFPCTLCDRQCLSEAQLRGHMVVHTGVKAFKCDYCDKAFSAEPSLKRHKQVTHGEAGGKSFPCEVCGQVFLRKDNFKVHLRKHYAANERKEQTCGICQKDFMSSRDLQAHLKSHAGDCLYECAVCSLGFTSQKTLNNHYKSDMHLLTSAGVS